MSDTNEQIDHWLNSASESSTLELKEAKNSFSLEKLFEYCAAIHNEKGGRLILGISDQRPRRVVGTSAFPNLNGIKQRLLEKLGFRTDIEERDYQGKRLLVFTIPSRPQGHPCGVDGKYMMRNGESLVPMTADQLRAIFEEGKLEWLEEYTKTGLDEQEVIELLDTQTFFDLLKIPFPTSREGVIEGLRQHMVIDVMPDHTCSIRKVGALLLAKDLAKFPELVRKAPRVIKYKGLSKMETIIDLPVEKGYAVGFRGLVEMIAGYLPQNETMERALRVSVKLAPMDAIREIVANAIVHQDFTATGTSVTVEIYDNRVDVTNPGEPLVEVNRFIDGCQSRNERFASLMRRFGVCEEKGSGIDRVIQAAEVYQLPAPDFRKGYHSTIVTIFGPRKFEDMNREDRVRACYQHCSLKWVMSETMTNESLRAL